MKEQQAKPFPKYANVLMDPAIVQHIRELAARERGSIKALIEEAVRIAGKTDPRFRFQEQRAK